MTNTVNLRMLGILSIVLALVFAASCGSSTDVTKDVSSTYTISGVVFVDGNSDGVFNTGDLPDGGVTLQLVNMTVSPPVVLYETTANALGQYSLAVAQGSTGVFKVVEDDPGDDYIPPFCFISGDPSMDRVISFYR